MRITKPRTKTTTTMQARSFRVEWRINVLQNVKPMKEHKVDIEVSTTIGTETKIVKQVS